MENREPECKSPAELSGDLHEFMADLMSVARKCAEKMTRAEHLDNVLKYGKSE